MPTAFSESLKPLFWVASAKKDLLEFSVPVIRNMGYALDFAQWGERSAAATPMQGFGGASVLEIRDNLLGDTFRGVYTVRFAGAIYVLHCFQKKSHRGIATDARDIALIHQRLAAAQAHYEEKMLDNSALSIEMGSENIFADLGQQDVAEMSLKSGLAVQIVRAMRARGLTQRQTAGLVGLKQPDLSNIARARLDGISVERLLAVLNRLGHRVEIRVAVEESADARTLVVAG